MFNGNVTLPSPEYLLEPQNITSALVKTLLVTSWRSGSTLIGELLNSHPGKVHIPILRRPQNFEFKRI